MKHKKIIFGSIIFVLLAGVLTANNKPFTKEEADRNKAEFITWLQSYDEARSDEKDVALGMMAQDFDSGKKHFSDACNKGNESGCFQLGLAEMAESNSIGTLLKLSKDGKNKAIAKRSAEFISAWGLDNLGAKNIDKEYIQNAIDAITPFANIENPNSEFLLAHLLNYQGYKADADKMLDLACNNPSASVKVKNYCLNSNNTDAYDKEDKKISKGQTQEVSTCQEK